jgi:hypothetical protein
VESGVLRGHSSLIPPGTNTLNTRGEVARGAAEDNGRKGAIHIRTNHSGENIHNLSVLSRPFFRGSWEILLRVMTIAMTIAIPISVAITGNREWYESSGTLLNLLSFKVFGQPSRDDPQSTITLPQVVG